MNETTSRSDDLIYAIESIPSWAELLNDARQQLSRQLRMTVGQILSTLLIATDDGANVIAVGGEIDNNGHGYLAIVTSNGVVYVDARKITTTESDHTVTLYPLSDVRNLSVATRSVFFEESASRRPRESRLSVEFEIAAHNVRLTVPDYAEVPFRTGDALVDAYKILWDR